MRIDPIFIVGDARSGTTYLYNLLIQHQDISLAPESNFVTSVFKHFRDRNIVDIDELNNLLDLIFAETKFRNYQFNQQELSLTLKQELPLSAADFIRRILLLYCQREFPARLVWGIKKPQYVFMVKRLKKQFPTGKFINIVRDGRAVFNSKIKAIYSKTGQPFETDPVLAANRWRHAIQAFDEFALTYPNNSLEISYEALLTNISEVLASIFNFLEVPSDGSVAIQAQTGIKPFKAIGANHIHYNIGKPPQINRINSWQQELSPEQIKAFEQIAGKKLKQKEYKLEYEMNYISYRITNKIKRIGNKISQVIFQ